MRRALFIVLLAGVGFFSVLLWQLPASLIVSRIRGISCGAVDGSIWSGSCTGLVVQGMSLGDVRWTLHPAALLIGELAAHVSLTDGPAVAHADVETRSTSSITLRNLVADLPLDPAALPRVPPNLRGTAHLDITRVTWAHDAITRLEGRIEAHDLEDHTRGTTRFGSYALTFPPGGQGIPVARLQDLGGPLSVEGTVQLTLRPGFSGGRYTVQALVSPRASAPPELKENLSILGFPDAQGRRQFGMEGTF